MRYIIPLAALLSIGCASGGHTLRIDGDGYQCELSALASVQLEHAVADAAGHCAVRIPGGGPGVLAGFIGTVYATAMYPGESEADARRRALDSIAPNPDPED